ncbi:MAG TPA: right-handed parallel beta-helix repeat-containing protein [Microlunatus sp.]
MTAARPVLRRATIGVLAVVLAVVGLVAGPSSTASAEPADVPGQYISKLYTEALGRLPYQTEWQAATQVFSEGGCSSQTLAEVGQQVYTSADFAALGYDNVAKLSTLYRGVWNGEADVSGLSERRDELDHGESWSTMVAKFFVSDEFNALVPKICAGARDSSATSYAWGSQASGALPSDSAGFNGGQDQLQQILDDTPPGGTVQLAERALITVTKPLSIPHGVTLTTTGEPDITHYAVMGRLVRDGDFNGPVVEVGGGAKLTGVWVDGARKSPGDGHPGRTDVRVLGGQRTQVSGNKISNSMGTAGIEVYGQARGYSCSDVTVSRNLITAYSNDHYLTRQLEDGTTAGMWTDGIASGCADTKITNNQIVDTGGVGIGLYPATSSAAEGTSQRSVISKNRVLSAGVPMYAAIVADPQYYLQGRGDASRYDYRGARIDDNLLWTAPNTHFVIGIAAGTRAWYGGTAMVGPNSGHGLAVSGNSTGKLSARVRTGIAISGMDDVRLGANPADWSHDDVPGKTGNACPAVDVAASTTAGTADGLQTRESFDDTGFDGCMGEP